MYTTPPLTTVRQPLYDVGISLGKTMLSMLGQGEAPTGAPPALSLVVRESVRRVA